MVLRLSTTLWTWPNERNRSLRSIVNFIAKYLYPFLRLQVEAAHQPLNSAPKYSPQNTCWPL
jgi:hypothetical protein